MASLFSSALNLINNATASAAPAANAAAGGSGPRTDHELVGTNAEIGGLKLRIRYLIAEGGFAHVFAATDSSGYWYAIKRLLAADKQMADAILLEIRFLRQLTGHPAIIQYIQAASLSPQESGHGRAEFLVLTELCTGGQIVDALRRQAFNPYHVCRVFSAACRAVKHMHSKTPPIIHRDLKIENLLLDDHGFTKLCDFGSATTQQFIPDDTWSVAKRQQIEEEMARHTTPMYRSPEMLDLWLDYPIGPPLDIWALGCVLYYLCYRTHPFEDSAKLRIINAKYTLPEDETPFTVYHPIIESCLQIDPSQRPLIGDLCERIEAVAGAIDCDLAKPCIDLMPAGHQPQSKSGPNTEQAHHQIPAAPQRPSSGGPPSRPPPPVAAPQDGGASSGMMFSLQNRAGSLFKNIKETGRQVAQTVQEWDERLLERLDEIIGLKTGVGTRQVDFVYVTSRVLVIPMPEGVPESLLGPVEDNVRQMLETRHRAHYAVYNLSNRHMKHGYDGRLSDVPLPPTNRPPTLNALFAICANMSGFLKQSTSNVVVLCGSEAQCAMVCSSLLLYSRLAHRPLTALELFMAKSNRSQALELSPSVHRYLDYTCKIITTKQNLHRHPIRLRAVTCHGIPLFNKMHNGCRPFVDVWSSGHKVFSTAQQTIEQIREYTTAESDEFAIDLNQEVFEDVTVCLFHARSTLGAKVQGKFAGLPIARVSFHTSFVSIEHDSGVLLYPLGDLDETDQNAKYPAAFRVQLDYTVSPQARPVGQLAPAYLTYDPKATSSRHVVTDKQEKEQLEQLIGASMVVDRPSAGGPSAPPAPRSVSPRPHVPPPIHQHPPPPPRSPRPPPPSKPPAKPDPPQDPPARKDPPVTDFFGTLDWGSAPSVPDAQQQQSEPDFFKDDDPPPAAPANSQRRSSTPPSPPNQRSPEPTRPQGATGGKPKMGMDAAEAYERQYGIRVRSDADEDACEPEYIDPLARMAQQKADKARQMEEESGTDAGVHDLLGDFNDLSTTPSQTVSSTSQSGAVAPSSDEFLADFLAPHSNKVASSTATPHPTPVPSSAHLDDMDMFGSGTAQTTNETNNKADNSGPDLLQDWSDTLFDNVKSGSSSSMSRNQSTPAFNVQRAKAAPSKPAAFDPFGDLGSLTSSSSTSNVSNTKPKQMANARSNANSPAGWMPPSSAAASNTLGGSTGQSINHMSGRSTPNYSSSNFADLNKGSGGYAAPRKVAENAFDDILSSSGFTASQREKANATMGNMRRDEEVKNLDPLQIKIRDWTRGKERNIRALLGSLHDVVWDEAKDKWEPVAMSQLLSAPQIKKTYRKACLLVHPDKQTGTPHEALARAIFTELNDAWNDFEEAGMQSLG